MSRMLLTFSENGLPNVLASIQVMARLQLPTELGCEVGEEGEDTPNIAAFFREYEPSLPSKTTQIQCYARSEAV